jgi:hypothetical protein
MKSRNPKYSGPSDPGDTWQEIHEFKKSVSEGTKGRGHIFPKPEVTKS